MKKILLFISLCFLVISTNVNANQKELVSLKRCVDGDTAVFILNDKETRVRFLAIDTPESVSTTKDWTVEGKKASVYTCEMITNARKLELEFDPKSSKIDKYGRYLAWVWVDEILLQEKIVALGYAKIEYIYGDYLYLDELYSAEETAKTNKLGIWNNTNLTMNKEKNLSFGDIFIVILVLLLLYTINKSSFKKLIKNKLKKII